MYAPSPRTPLTPQGFKENQNKVPQTLSKKNKTQNTEHSNTSLLSNKSGLLLCPLLSQLAGILGAVAEPLAVEVEDVRCDDQRNGSGREDKARDGELPLGAGPDVRIERSGVEGGDAGEEVAAETIAAGGTGGVFAVGSDLEGELVSSTLVWSDGRGRTM